MDTDTNQFWLVWNPTGSNPSYRHVSEELALFEAQRLAERHHGERFYVLRATHLARRVTVAVTTLRDPDNAPF